MTTRRRPRRTRAATKSRPRAAGKIRAPRPDSFLHSPYLYEAGVPVTWETALQVSAVYACCRLIVDCIAPAPVTVMELQAGGKRVERPDDSVSWLLNHGAPVAQAPDAPTAQAIEEALLWSALLLGDGNGYAEIQRDLAGRAFALWPIEPSRVTPRRDASGYYYEIQQPEGGSARLDAINMFHLRGPSLFGWTGDSIAYRAAKAMGTAHAQNVFRAAYFANGTVISGLLASDKAITQDQANKAKERWNESHRGPASAHGIAVVGQGLKYQAIGHNAQESQLVEASRFQVHEIARFYGVPTTLLADNEAWTNLGELYLGFFRSALKPWASRFDQEASRKLVPWKAPWREVEHDLTALTLGSFKDQIAACRDAVNGGIWTRNEARAVFGKNSVPGGDTLVVEASIRSLEDALNPPEPTPAASPAPEEQDGEEMPEKMPAREMNRDAVLVMFAHELRRYERKIKNRRADVKRELEEAEIAKLREPLAGDCAHLIDFAGRCGVAFDPALVDAGAKGIEQGEPPDLAAARLLERP